MPEMGTIPNWVKRMMYVRMLYVNASEVIGEQLEGETWVKK